MDQVITEADIARSRADPRFKQVLLAKSLEQLLKDVNLSRHGDFAADEQQNQSAIRAVFRKAPEPQ